MSTVQLFKSFFSSLLVVGAMLLSQSAVAGIAGNVQFVHGNVQVVNSAGQSRALLKGDAVHESDTVTTVIGATAQIKMRDGGYIVIRPDSRLKFDSFVFSGEQDGNERSFFSLLKGGIRAITGLIGQRNKKSYHITTPESTIGIRGTDHETFVVTADSPMAAVAPLGTYNKVNRGETTITTDKGTISVLPNQMGFAGATDLMPQLQPLNLRLFTVAPPPALGSKQGTDVRDGSVVDSAVQEQDSATGDPLPGNHIQVPIKSKDGVPTSPQRVF